MKKIVYSSFVIMSLFIISCTAPSDDNSSSSQPVYQDKPYVQDLSIKFYKQDESLKLSKAYMDQNGVIQVMSSEGVLRTHDGQFLYPGELIADRTYRPLTDKNLSELETFRNQFVYLDDEAVLSNAWAGSLYIRHGLADAHMIAAGKNFDFLISNGKSLEYLSDNKVAWKGTLDGDKVIEINYDEATNTFFVLGSATLSAFTPVKNAIEKIVDGADFTSFAIAGDKMVIGTATNGYLEVNKATGKQIGEIHTKLPWTEITAVESVDGKLWFGSTKGAFMLKDDGKFNYYYGERWLPGNQVIHISKAKDNSVLVLTDAGLGQIVFKNMTLHDKAMYYEKQVRNRHIRLGFNASLVNMEKGNINSGRLSDSDNDGLWTTMYLAGEVFRYATTGSEDALFIIKDAMDAMERLFSINPVPGFPSRSFERSGYVDRLHDPDRWQHSDDPEWDWKSTTSSDEAIGHIFAYSVMAELMDGEMKERAITLIDTLMSHVVRNDFYMIDYDGKPTTWGRWHPDYVNARPKMVGDRKINSSNIIGMLQTAYHFTGKEKYKDAAFYLMNEHGYLENLMKPMKEVGPAPDDADDWSKMLSGSWNHSDDEMYFVGYWGLYHYAFNDTLKAMFKKSIIDHWEIERPEKEGAWNIMTALTGTPEFDLDEAVWYLQEHPMDLVDWAIMNSHRKDIELLEPNFRRQSTKEVLPPDERGVQRHNGNMFNMDRRGSNGVSEHSAGDIWLLPYWMGRYLEVISAPTK